MTMMNMMKALCLALLVFLSTIPAHADDPRIRYVNYNQNDATEVLAGLGVSTAIILGKGEEIASISAGDTVSWSIVPAANSAGIIFVKPKKKGAVTNINIVTNKRIYTLVLKASSLNSVKAAFQVRFRYPDDAPEITPEMISDARKNISTPLLDKARANEENVNHNYVYRGDDVIKPRVVFDDGEHTFMQFEGEVPAIFIVETKKRESLINFRMEGENFVVIDKVAAQFTLRAGDRTLCLYNAAYAARKAPDDLEREYGPKKLK
jgi:type IV secretion system protein VirB9